MLAVGMIPGGKLGMKFVGKATSELRGGLNLFRHDHPISEKVTGWKDGDYFLKMYDKGSPKANWKQNSGFLRQEMNKGNPIYDSFRDSKTGLQIPVGGIGRGGQFLNAERKLLESRGWKYNKDHGAYYPPSL